MATLYIAECVAIGGGGNHPVSGAQAPFVTEQTVNIGGSAQQSNIFNNNTGFLRVHTDTTCSIKIGVGVTATVVNARMFANQTEYFSIPLNSGMIISVIINS